MLLAATAAAVTLAGCGSAAKPTATKPAATVPAVTAQTTVPETSLIPTTPSTVTTVLPATTASTRAVTTTTRPPATGSSIVQLTSANTGQTFQLAVGQMVEVRLEDSGIRWGTISYSPTAPLRGDPTPSPPPDGQLLIWTAVQPGTVVVSAQGSPICGPPVDAVCPDFIRVFTVHVVVV